MRQIYPGIRLAGAQWNVASKVIKVNCLDLNGRIDRGAEKGGRRDGRHWKGVDVQKMEDGERDSIGKV